eukprot:RCo051140
MVVPSKWTKRPNPTKITPERGQVLILLAGRYRGRRVICLGPWDRKGVFLVTGPYRVNGVPLRRVNRRYVICTSTKIDISKMQLNLKKNTFKKKKLGCLTHIKRRGGGKKEQREFFRKKLQKWRRPVPQKRKDLQRRIDEQLIRILKNADPLLTKYLGSIFTLRKNDLPHDMKF